MDKEVVQGSKSLENTAKIVYILYLAGIVFGITGLIGVVMAYINRGDAPDWLKSHYQFQIRTFWIGFIYTFIGIIGMMFTFVLIGYLVFLFWVVWLVVRCVKGLKYLDKKEPYPNPTGWMF